MIMAEDTQNFSDGIIQDIENAESPESVTNGMVAAVLEHHNALVKKHGNAVADINRQAQANAKALADIKPISDFDIDRTLLGLVMLDDPDVDFMELVAHGWKLTGYGKVYSVGDELPPSPLIDGTVTFADDFSFGMSEASGSIYDGSTGYERLELSGTETFGLYRSEDDGVLYVSFGGGAFPLVRNSPGDRDEIYRVEALDAASLVMSRPTADFDKTEVLSFTTSDVQPTNTQQQ